MSWLGPSLARTVPSASRVVRLYGLAHDTSRVACHARPSLRQPGPSRAILVRWRAGPGLDGRGKTGPPQNAPDEKRRKLSPLTREDIYTVPNLLTFSRLLATPLIGYLVVEGSHPGLALCVFCYAAVTDVIDGWIARRWRLRTVVGSVIDPMADKALITVLTAALAAKGALPGKCLFLLLVLRPTSAPLIADTRPAS